MAIGQNDNRQLIMGRLDRLSPEQADFLLGVASRMLRPNLMNVVFRESDSLCLQMTFYGPKWELEKRIPGGSDHFIKNELDILPEADESSR